ncbi:MAG: hypothetical protein KDA41_19660, partial [Planctomycetales bacterium]|nr:hypothetical protein [Planctomycetales bacterium]
MKTSSPNCLPWIATPLIAIALCVAGSSAALAQADPFGGDPFGSAPAPKPAAEPEDAKADAPKGPTADDVAAAKQALIDRQAKGIERERMRPVLDAIAETRPSSPVELMGAIESLMNLNQPDDAKPYLQKLLALKLNDEALYVLQRKVGSGVFFRLSADKRYHPEGHDLAESVLNAAHKQVRDPRRLDTL